GIGTGATANSFAWINAQKQPLEYFRLSMLGIQAWRELQAEIGADLPIRWGGSLEWSDTAERAKVQAEARKRYQSWGDPIQEIDAARIHALEPGIITGGAFGAAHAEIEGSADPVRATEVIMARAVSAGATIVHPAEITGLDQSGGRLRAVKTTRGDLPADV